MDKDLILNVTNEVIKGKSPKRSILDIFSIKRDPSLEPIVSSYIKNSEDSVENILELINQLSETIKEPSEIIMIVSDIIEIDYLRRRLMGMISSYKKKGIILLLILYIVFPFIASTLNILAGLKIVPPLPIMEGEIQSHNTTRIIIYSIFLETLATLNLCRQFNLDTKKLLLIQLTLFITIFISAEGWSLHIQPPSK